MVMDMRQKKLLMRYLIDDSRFDRIARAFKIAMITKM